jgi:hypothetical protein
MARSFGVGLTNLLKFPLLSIPLGRAVLECLEHAGWRPSRSLHPGAGAAPDPAAAAAAAPRAVSTVLAITGITVGMAVCFILPAAVRAHTAGAIGCP